MKPILIVVEIGAIVVFISFVFIFPMLIKEGWIRKFCMSITKALLYLIITVVTLGYLNLNDPEYYASVWLPIISAIESACNFRDAITVVKSEKNTKN